MITKLRLALARWLLAVVRLLLRGTGYHIRRTHVGPRRTPETATNRLDAERAATSLNPSFQAMGHAMTDALDRAAEQFEKAVAPAAKP